MKKILKLVIALVMTLTLASCSSSSDKESSSDAPTIRVLGISSSEQDINILVDQFKKAGYKVETNIQPDYGSFKTVENSGEWDVAFTGWTTVTGNPDYAVRDIFSTGGAYNTQGLSDAKVDELIDLAASQTPTEYIKTYTELENYLVSENAYILPVSSNLRINAMNSNLLKVDSVSNPKSASSAWNYYEYNDSSLNSTRPLITTQTQAALTSLDPIQANDGSINSLSSNLNVRIINLTEEDEITTDRSLTYNYAIAEGNEDYYFILKDDVNFAKVENGKAVDTGVRVGAEDVLFSLNRAKDKNSVPTHKTYGLHSHMENVEIVTDLDSLSTIKDSDSGKTVLEMLNANLTKEISSLTNDKTKASNKDGVYQVVKVTTTEPFPQVLNYLAHQSAGIVSEKQVTEVNSKVDLANYDPTKDVIYGDFNHVKNVDNNLWFSGPYAMTKVDDLEAVFEANPGFMTGTSDAPRIETIIYRFIKDQTSAVSSFRAGEIDLLPFVDTNSVELLEGVEGIEVSKRSSNGVSYCTFNLAPGSIMNNKDLRLSLLLSIDQNAFISVNKGLLNPAYSTLSTLIDTGNVLKQNLELSKEHYNKFLAEYNKDKA